MNIKKTKIVIFRNSYRIKDNEKFYFDNCELDIVDSFNYLGLCFYYNGKFNFAEKQLASQGRKALFALYKNINDMYLNVETSLSRFDTYIGSALQYASEIWGNHRGNCVEKVQLDFCKRLLGVKKSTCNVMIYSELGRLPLHVIRKFKILKYWVKIVSSDNCILQQCYQEMLINIDTNNWLSGVRDILCELGLLNIWYSQNVNSDILQFIKQRLYDQEKQRILCNISNMKKCFLSKHIIDRISLQHYLKKCIPKKYVKYITMLRLSSHSLSMETGRYQGINTVNRLCQFCKSDVEDEFHFVLKCPVYDCFRKLYIKNYYRTHPSVFKLVQLLCTENFKDLCNLGIFLMKSFNLRQNIIMSS